MNQASYSFFVVNDALRFEFVSVGKNVINKAIIYTQTDNPYLYSLALVDVYDDGTADDKAISDNGDMEKILLTVFYTFTVFFQYYPKSVIVFSGSTPSRTRLYRIAISHELFNLTSTYNVWGITNDSYEIFRKGRSYTGFLLSLKSINIA